MQVSVERHIAVGADVGDEGAAIHSQLSSDVVDHDLLSNPVEFEMTAAGQERKALLKVTLERPSWHARQSPVTEIEAELAVLLTDKIQHGQARLSRCVAKAAAELLEEHRDALRGPEKQDGVDIRDVKALVEDVDGEDAAQYALAHALAGLAPFRSRCVGVDCGRR